MDTILFVDDHYDFRTVFAEVLRNDGYTVLEAGTGTEAENRVERYGEAIGILLVEALLTTTNGLRTAKRLHQLLPEMRVLFFSENSAEALIERGLLPEGAHFLRKPFTSQQLMASLREFSRSLRRAERSSGNAG